MQTVKTFVDLRQKIQAWRQQGKRIAFVPTMGNIHAGHSHLVDQARQLGDKVVVSIFVNPAQFGINDDFEAYPRTLIADSAKLEDSVDLLFVPSLDEVYPNGYRNAVSVDVEALGLVNDLCGASRPGHFNGVATVVAKLFNLIQPDLALFGEKDYQQLQVLRRMVTDLCFPIKIVGVETVREPDGLALSSRNGYLDAKERAIAPGLHVALQQAALRLADGERDFAAVEAAGITALNAAGFEAEYFVIRQTENLTPPMPESLEVVILAAAKLGNTRLIDNLRQSLLK